MEDNKFRPYLSHAISLLQPELIRVITQLNHKIITKKIGQQKIDQKTKKKKKKETTGKRKHKALEAGA